MLFPALERKGMPKQVGPIAVMLAEHDEGRRYVKSMVEAVERLERGDAAAEKTFAENARSYVELLAQHIQKEDNILYNMTDRILNEDEHKPLLDRFEEVEEQRIGRGRHEELHKSIHRVKNELTSRSTKPNAAQ